MTAIAVITTPDNVDRLGRAAYTEPDGILRHFAPKVVLCPDWDCVISSSVGWVSLPRPCGCAVAPQRPGFR